MVYYYYEREVNNMTAREYFWNNVVWAIEIEREDGSRYWNHPKGNIEKSGLLSIIDASTNLWLSDIDFGDQDEWFTDRILKLANLNFFKNEAWCRKNNLKGYFDVINFILDNELYKA